MRKIIEILKNTNYFGIPLLFLVLVCNILFNIYLYY